MKTSLAITLLLLFSCQKEVTQSKLNSSASSNSVIHSNQIIAIDQDDSWNPCTNEYIHITGNLKIESNEVVTGDKIIDNGNVIYNGVTVTGDQSGLVYKAMLHLKFSSMAEWNPAINAYEVRNSNNIQRVKFILPGKGNNLTLILNFKIVTDANFNLKVFDVKFVYDACN